MMLLFSFWPPCFLWWTLLDKAKLFPITGVGNNSNNINSATRINNTLTHYPLNLSEYQGPNRITKPNVPSKIFKKEKKVLAPTMSLFSECSWEPIGAQFK